LLKVKVMSDEEAERYNKWQKDLDDTCDKIKFYVCLCMYFYMGLSNCNDNSILFSIKR